MRGCGAHTWYPRRTNMSFFAIGLIAFMVVFGGVRLGMTLPSILPLNH
jgi:hypothetical protein